MKRTLIGIFTVLLAVSFVACQEKSFSGQGRRGSGKPGKPGDGDGVPPSTPAPPGGDDLGTGDGSDHISTLKKPAFALMARDLRCGMCHLTIKGDLVTTGDVMSFEPDRSLPAPGSDDHILSPFRIFTKKGEYDERIEGTWFISGVFPNDRSKTEMKLTVTNEVKQNYVGPEIPKSGFPKLVLAKAEAVSKGTLTGKDNAGKDVSITGKSASNVILDGTTSPIKINGEVLVNGDLVILGSYSGRGTIYATGNIYIAGSITASDSAFPFPADKIQALARGKELALAGQKDALALVANSSIILGDSRHQTVTGTPKITPPPVKHDNVMTWFPDYSKLYKGKVGKNINLRLDAFLYSQNMIAGKTGNYVLNGGMICDSFHILGIGSEAGRNVINYDFRMAHGLKIMEAFDDSF
jgi:hypothetical protein